MLDKDKKILIVGLGLMGGSYAQSLSQEGYEVGAITKDQDSIDYALQQKMIQHGMIEVKKEYVEQFDIIVFALYPKVLIEWIEKYHSYFKKNAIITDVTGVKGSIVYKIQELLKNEKCEYIAAHPMAGKEIYGVYNADKSIFMGANYIVTPTSKNTEEAIEACKELGRILQFKKISVLTPEEHDEMIAFLSQLTHCIAVALMTCKESKHLADYTGDSFRDLTRIANINENMWSELFLMNKEELISQMNLFLEEFSKLRDAIEEEDVDKMKEMMKLSTERRNYFNE